MAVHNYGTPRCHYSREVVEDILSNPIFANHMTFDPYKVFRNNQREYGEFFSGERAHEIQV